MNFTNVRICSIALAMVVVPASLGDAQPAQAASAGLPTPGVTIAVMGTGFRLADVAEVPALSPGVASAGIGSVPAEQTYLDIGQGNRIAEPLYEEPLPRLAVRAGGVPRGAWGRVLERAAGAPAQVAPGLLGQTLLDAGVSVRAERGAGLGALIAADASGRVERAPAGACGLRGCGPGLSVVRASRAELARMAAGLRGWDLLIAIEGRRPGRPARLLTAGVAGRGLRGNLTSESTRTRGVVLSTDLAPTVLERLGVEVPEEMNGRAIEAEGEPDPGAVESLEERLTERPSRTLVVLVPLEVWVALTALAVLALRGRGARLALPLLALSCVWAPLMLLAGAALRPGETTEALIFGIGAPALAGLTLLALPACAGLALACGVTVAAHAVDVVAGSPLTALSVLGPNPGGGVRFFGIGNELEATLVTLTLIGTGVGLAAARVTSGRRAAAWFAATARAAAAVCAPGRFGADVGAAIVLGAGAAAAAALALGLDRRRLALAVVVVPVIGLGMLAAIDLIAGGGAHLTGSVLGANDTGALSDVLERRLTLTVRSFTHPVYPQLLVAMLALLALGIWQRRRVLGWFGDRWQARCGYAAAFAGVLVGTAANDSGALLLTIGTIYLAVCGGFFWATQRERTA